MSCEGHALAGWLRAIYLKALRQCLHTFSEVRIHHWQSFSGIYRLRRTQGIHSWAVGTIRTPGMLPLSSSAFRAVPDPPPLRVMGLELQERRGPLFQAGFRSCASWFLTGFAQRHALVERVQEQVKPGYVSITVPLTQVVSLAPSLGLPLLQGKPGSQLPGDNLRVGPLWHHWPPWPL